MVIALIIILVIVVLLVAVVWGTYNSLVKLNERVNEAWSDITVQLKYRADLIPNVVETVKGYAKHEKSAFEDVTKARSAVMSANTVKGTAEAERSLEGALSKIFAIAEAYPELKANTNFQQLQLQLQLNGAVKVILNGPLVAPCDHDDILDAGINRLLDNILDRRLVHNRQHFLGLRL